jgi:hypothetical protein
LETTTTVAEKLPNQRLHRPTPVSRMFGMRRTRMNDTPEPTSEQWKNRVDALRFISETHRTIRNQRRTTQFKVFLTTITFYTFIGAAQFTGKLQPPQHHRLFFVLGAWFLIAGVAVLSSVYLLGLDASNRVNRKLAENAEREISRMLNLPDAEGAGRTIAKTYFWEITMISIFALAVGVSITLF